jgi:hypothetical protein
VADSVEVQLALATERLKALTFLYSSLDKRASDAEVVRADQARQIQQLLDLARKREEEKARQTILTMYFDSFKQETWGGKVLLSVGPIAVFVGVFMAATGTSLIDIAKAISLLLHGSTQ